MATTVIGSSSRPIRPLLIGAAGAGIVLLSVGAAFLSGTDGWSGSRVVAGLLAAAGLLEMSAGTLRKDNWLLATLAGATTAFAGVMFATAQVQEFVPALYVIIGWLGTRGVLLTIAGLAAWGSLRLWTFLSAAMDLALAAILLAGLAAMTFVISLFGATSEMTISFSAILALSFVVTGAYLIEVATTEQ